MKVEVYWLPHCSTCKKAVSFLEENNVEVFRFQDIKTEPLTRAEIEGLAAKVGGADALFSKRAIKYRSMKLNERDLTDKDMIGLMEEEYTFIKRPVVVAGNKALAGFSSKRYEEFVNE